MSGLLTSQAIAERHEMEDKLIEMKKDQDDYYRKAEFEELDAYMDGNYFNSEKESGSIEPVEAASIWTLPNTSAFEIEDEDFRQLIDEMNRVASKERSRKELEEHEGVQQIKDEPEKPVFSKNKSGEIDVGSQVLLDCMSIGGPGGWPILLGAFIAYQAARYAYNVGVEYRANLLEEREANKLIEDYKTGLVSAYVGLTEEQKVQTLIDIRDELNVGDDFGDFLAESVSDSSKMLDIVTTLRAMGYEDDFESGLIKKSLDNSAEFIGAADAEMLNTLKNLRATYQVADIGQLLNEAVEDDAKRKAFIDMLEKTKASTVEAEVEPQQLTVADVTELEESKSLSRFTEVLKAGFMSIKNVMSFSTDKPEPASVSKPTQVTSAASESDIQAATIRQQALSVEDMKFIVEELKRVYDAHADEINAHAAAVQGVEVPTAKPSAVEIRFEKEKIQEREARDLKLRDSIKKTLGSAVTAIEDARMAIQAKFEQQSLDDIQLESLVSDVDMTAKPKARSL